MFLIQMVELLTSFFAIGPALYVNASEVLLKEDNYHPAISVQTDFQKSSNKNIWISTLKRRIL